MATPIIAATLTVISGLGQNFHWGSTWRDMVMFGLGAGTVLVAVLSGWALSRLTRG